MSNQIDDMLNQASERSNDVAQTQTSLPSTTVQGGLPTARTAAPSAEDFLRSGMTVENWLKVSEDGLKIKVENDTALLDKLAVSIDMSEVAFTKAIKYGNPPTYHKTYDGVVCADGQTLWTDALEEASRFSQKPYNSADIPMTLEEDVVGKGGKVLMTKGQRIGYSLSTTNKDAFAKFMRSITDAGIATAVIDTTLGYEAKSNKNNQNWGIVTFESNGELAPQD